MRHTSNPVSDRELKARLMQAALMSEHPLSTQEIDRILGLERDEDRL